MSTLPPPPDSPPPVDDAPTQQAGYAGFWMRFLAVVVDGLIIGVPFGILGILTGATDTNTVDAFGNRSHTTNFRIGVGVTPGVELWFNLLNLAVSLVYFAVLEGGPTGQTLGKRVCNLRVVDEATGQPGIGTGRAIGRYFARWLSAIPIALGYLWMLWDPKKQCWHDKLAKDVVTRT